MRLKLTELALIIGIYGFESLDRSVNPECKDLDSKLPFRLIFKFKLCLSCITVYCENKNIECIRECNQEAKCISLCSRDYGSKIQGLH